MSGVVNFRCGIVHIIVFLSPLHSQMSKEILPKLIQIESHYHRVYKKEFESMHISGRSIVVCLSCMDILKIV